MVQNSTSTQTWMASASPLRFHHNIEKYRVPTEILHGFHHRTLPLVTLSLEPLCHTCMEDSCWKVASMNKTLLSNPEPYLSSFSGSSLSASLPPSSELLLLAVALNQEGMIGDSDRRLTKLLLPITTAGDAVVDVGCDAAVSCPDIYGTVKSQNKPHTHTTGKANFSWHCSCLGYLQISPPPHPQQNKPHPQPHPEVQLGKLLPLASDGNAVSFSWRCSCLGYLQISTTDRTSPTHNHTLKSRGTYHTLIALRSAFNHFQHGFLRTLVRPLSLANIQIKHISLPQSLDKYLLANSFLTAAFFLFGKMRDSLV